MNATNRLRSGIAALLLLGVTGAGAQAASEPYTPADDSVVLERLAPAANAVEGLRALQAQRRALAKIPDNLDAAASFARHAIELGRAEADPRYFGYAESALAPWMTLTDPPPRARLLRATLRQQRHDFAGALADLDVLIAANGRDAQARLTRAVVLMVQGRPADAITDCNALIEARADLVASAVCISEARSLDGHADAAIATLKSVLAEAGHSIPPSEKVWALTTLAEIEVRQARQADAEAHFREALALLAATGERNPYLLTAVADFLLASGRAREARALTADSTRVDNLLLRFALAQAALGEPAAAESIRLLQARFAEAALRGATVHLREEAMFELRLQHNPARALTRALQNWESQREPADARLLFDAAIAAGQPAAAQPVLDWMQRTAIEDPALKALAATIGAAGARP